MDSHNTFQPPLSQELQVAIASAKKGGDKAMEYYESDIAFEVKEDNSVVTKTDVESENIIKEEIRRSFPGAKFVAEESGGESSEVEFWIIDPIDATRSFQRGVPTWNSMVALCKNKEIVLGVSYFPALDMLIYAEKGKGAYLNEKKVQVSGIASLDKAFVGVGSPGRFTNKQILLDIFTGTASSRSLDLTFTNTLVAKGSMDAMVDAYGKVWDLAAFKVIIEEAGGKVTRLDGSEWTTDENRGGVLSNGHLHDEIITLIQNATKI
jgi:histidinol-phosphatase